MNINKTLKRIYRFILDTYDEFTMDKFECSIGDILLKRGQIYSNQLLVASRLLDVEKFYGGDNSFYFQNTISRATYGKHHNEIGGNNSFTKLINSYKSVGYDPSSFLTVDEDVALMDGNHRTGLNLYHQVETINVHRVHRVVESKQNTDTYFNLGLNSSFIHQLYAKFDDIQEWLINTGNTFVACVSNSTNETVDNIVEDLNKLCNVLRINSRNALRNSVLLGG